jgi:hypothetical protein
VQQNVFSFRNVLCAFYHKQYGAATKVSCKKGVWRACREGLFGLIYEKKAQRPFPVVGL